MLTDFSHMWVPSQAASDTDMYWVGPVYVWCGGKGTAPGCARKREPKGTKRCNLHFFAPIWMAQSVVHNFRRMSMADLKPREPGYILCKEGWHEWDGRGKQEEEAFAGHTLGCIRLMVTDNNIEPFHWQDWEPIEHFAAQGVRFHLDCTYDTIGT